MDGATIVIRDGFIQAVGREVAAPADARVWEMKGKTIYAGFIDPCLALESTNRPVTTSRTEFDSMTASAGANFFGVPAGEPRPGYEVPQVIPEARVARSFSADKKALESARELGFTAGNVVPAKGIVRGVRQRREHQE